MLSVRLSSNYCKSTASVIAKAARVWRFCLSQPQTLPQGTGAVAGHGEFPRFLTFQTHP
jgi:hypothetical protein